VVELRTCRSGRRRRRPRRARFEVLRQAWDGSDPPAPISAFRPPAPPPRTRPPRTRSRPTVIDIPT